MATPPDALFADPRLAAVYDAFEGRRDDLDHYEAILRELGARRILDIGCGTGELACRLAVGGFDVVGVDPAAAMLDRARTKTGAGSVRWIVGDVPTAAEQLGDEPSVDVAIMTGNVAQVFVDDGDWADTLAATAGLVRAGGHLVFETRVPERRAWESWVPDRSMMRLDVPGAGVVDSWEELLAVELPLVTFRSHTRFTATGDDLVSESTLRFRTRPEIESSLDTAGFEVVDVRDAPDRPGAEWVFVARRT